MCRTLLHASFDQLLAYFWRSQQWDEEDLTTREGVEEAMYRTVMIIRSPCIHAPFTHFAHEMYNRAEHGEVVVKPSENVFDALVNDWVTMSEN